MYKDPGLPHDDVSTSSVGMSGLVTTNGRCRYRRGQVSDDVTSREWNGDGSLRIPSRRASSEVDWWAEFDDIPQDSKPIHYYSEGCRSEDNNDKLFDWEHDIRFHHIEEGTCKKLLCDYRRLYDMRNKDMIKERPRIPLGSRGSFTRRSNHLNHSPVRGDMVKGVSKRYPSPEVVAGRSDGKIIYGSGARSHSTNVYRGVHDINADRSNMPSDIQQQTDAPQVPPLTIPQPTRYLNSIRQGTIHEVQETPVISPPSVRTGSASYRSKYRRPRSHRASPFANVDDKHRKPGMEECDRQNDVVAPKLPKKPLDRPLADVKNDSQRSRTKHHRSKTARSELTNQVQNSGVDGKKGGGGPLVTAGRSGRDTRTKDMQPSKSRPTSRTRIDDKSGSKPRVSPTPKSRVGDRQTPTSKTKWVTSSQYNGTQNLIGQDEQGRRGRTESRLGGYGNQNEVVERTRTGQNIQSPIPVNKDQQNTETNIKEINTGTPPQKLVRPENRDASPILNRVSPSRADDLLNRYRTTENVGRANRQVIASTSLPIGTLRVTSQTATRDSITIGNNRGIMVNRSANTPANISANTPANISAIRMNTSHPSIARSIQANVRTGPTLKESGQNLYEKSLDKPPQIYTNSAIVPVANARTDPISSSTTGDNIDGNNLAISTPPSVPHPIYTWTPAKPNTGSDGYPLYVDSMEMASRSLSSGSRGRPHVFSNMAKKRSQTEVQTTSRGTNIVERPKLTKSSGKRSARSEKVKGSSSQSNISMSFKNPRHIDSYFSKYFR